MKKLFMIIMCLITMPALSESITMCVAQNSVNVILDPNVSASATGNNQNSTWSATLSYGGIIQGVRACINTGENNKKGDTIAELEETYPDGIVRPISGGEKYGQYCWCKITHPVSSQWVFNFKFNSVEDCSKYCSSYFFGNGCADGFSQIKSSLYGSIQPD